MAWGSMQQMSPLPPMPLHSRISFIKRRTCSTFLRLSSSARKDGERDDEPAGKGGNTLDSFYERASGLLAESDGRMDSLSFGRKWRAAYPNDSLDTYRKMAKGTVGEILAASDLFNVTVPPPPCACHNAGVPF